MRLLHAATWVGLVSGCASILGADFERPAAPASAEAGPADDAAACSTDLQADARNCGACGHACASDEVCSRGSCRSHCDPGLLLCGASCVDVTTSAAHCGACDHACRPDESCVSSACTPPANAADACTADSCSAGCDPQSCPTGCCSGGQCVGGRSRSGCGFGGAACKTCVAPDICHAQECQAAALGCGDSSKGSPRTCANICNAFGRTCTPGCFNDESLVGTTVAVPNCSDLHAVSPSIAGCNDATVIPTGTSVACCCI